MKCRLCNSESIQEIYRKNDLYFFCNNCNLIFIDKDEFPDFKEERARYEEHDNNHENEGYVKMFQRFIESIIEPYQEKMGNKCLEFGCGPGPVLADLLEEIEFKVDKYDPHFYPEKVYKNQKYDLITSTEVWEHFKNPYKMIAEIVDQLKPEAFLAVMTSFHPGIDKFEDWWYPWDPTHIVFYNEKTMNWIAKEFSLEIVKIEKDKYCLFKKRSLN